MPLTKVTDEGLGITTGLHFVKLADFSQTGNTATSFSFHSQLNKGYQFYKLIGQIGGSQSTGDANMQVQFMDGTSAVTSSNYYSGNAGMLSDGNFNTGAGSATDKGFINVHTASGLAIYAEMNIIPTERWLYGWLYGHDQNTHIGLMQYGVKYNASITDFSGLKFQVSGGGNITTFDATLYGGYVNGALGG